MPLLTMAILLITMFLQRLRGEWQDERLDDMDRKLDKILKNTERGNGDPKHRDVENPDDTKNGDEKTE